jgi:hypothetical protein
MARWTLLLCALPLATLSGSASCGGRLTPGDGDTDADVDVDASPDADLEADSPSDGDADADLDGDPGDDADLDADPVGCTPGFQRCAPAGVETCRETGDGFDLEPCENGCAEEPEPHCGAWAMSNLREDLLDGATGGLGPATPGWSDEVEVVRANTDTGEIRAVSGRGAWTLRREGRGVDETTGIVFEVVAQPGGARAIGAFAMTEATVPAGVTLWAFGQNSFGLLARDQILVSGVVAARAYVDAGTGERFPGPGGYRATSGMGAGGSGITVDPNDGGGGGAGYGGAGGAAGPAAATVAGGATYGNEELVPLRGGSGGGEGAVRPGHGGPGGGACEIVSLGDITVEAGGGIDVTGVGGDGGGPGGGGGGGGSGGAILLEAPSITVRGTLAANGGGGGSGATSELRGGGAGDAGELGSTPASGGVPPGLPETACNGGDGGAGSTLEGASSPCDPTDVDGGGGGGGVGRIRLNGRSIDTDGATISPALGTAAATVSTLPIG